MDPPGLLSVRFVTVVVDLSGRMKLFGRVVERVWVILPVRVVCCLLWVGCLDVVLWRVFSLEEEADGLLISIGRVIRFALDEPMGFFSVVVEDFGVAGEDVNLLLVVIWPRRVGAVAVVLLELVVGRLGAVWVVRLLTMTGRVIDLVFDELMILFEVELGDLDGL